MELNSLFSNIKSGDEKERRQTISEIPSLVLASLEDRDRVLDQLLLLIYNLNINSEKFENLNANNRIFIYRNLLRLYAETISDHDTKQLSALGEIANLTHSSELLSELAHALHKCLSNLDEHATKMVDQALKVIKDKASANLYSDTLLMIHSLVAIN